MGETTLTLNAKAHELARRGVLETAATDLRNAAEELKELAEAAWPMRGGLEDEKAAVRLVRESLAAVDQVGWPDMEVVG